MEKFRGNQQIKSGYKRTIAEAALAGAAMTGVIHLTKDLRAKSPIKIGNAALEAHFSTMKERAAEARKNGEPVVELTRGEKAAGMTLLASYMVAHQSLEEVVFRLAPNAVVSKLKGEGKHWKTGVAASLAFAAYHNVIFDNEKGRPGFATDTLPIPQFAQGLKYWQVMKDRGIKHAIVAHTAFNAATIGTAIAISSYKRAQERKKSGQPNTEQTSS